MSESGQSPYAAGLEKNAANYVALTPLTFIERSAYIYPDRVAVIHGARRYTWRESCTRARRCLRSVASRWPAKTPSAPTWPRSH